MKKNIVQILFYIILTQISFSQTSEKIDHIGINDGLSMSTITGLIQDESGFIWIGTQEGLNRYDGYEFKILKKELGNENSLTSNYIMNLALDKFGNIWVSTGEGIDKFNIKTDKFSHYNYNFSDTTSLISDEIIRIVPTSNGNVWLGTNYEGICKFDYKTEKFTRYAINEDTSTVSGNIVTSIFEDVDGKIWIASLDGGIDIYDEKTDNFTKLDIDKSIYRGVSSILKKENKLYIATFLNGINVYDLETKTIEKIILDKTKTRKNEQPEIKFIRLDSKDKLWIATYTQGIYKLDLETRKTSYYSRGSENKLSNDNISAFLEDKNGIIWIGTYEDGINLIKPHNKIIENYTSDPQQINTLSGSSIFGLIQDKDKILWAGTQGSGINKINRMTGKISHILADPYNKEALSHNEITAIAEDQDGYLWVGTIYGLNRLDKKTGKFKRYFYSRKNFNTENSSLSSSSITALLVDKDNNLWIGTDYSGLNKLDPTRKKFKIYYNILGDDESLSSNNVITLFSDSEGYIWTSSWLKGLNRVDPETDKIKRYIYNPDNPSSLQTNTVYSISEDSDGFLWFGSTDGLIKFDKKTEIFKSYTEKDGLPNNSVYGILEDQDGFLWITTNRGIAKFDKNKEVFKIYDEKDGFQGLEFNANAYYKTSDGELIFGGYLGISAFYPKNIKDYSYSSTVTITEVKIGNDVLKIGKKREGKDIITENISYVDEINLPYFENNISINYSAMNYFAPEKIKYSYKLEGMDEDWIFAENRRFVAYNKLPPGNYVFRVRSTNNEGLWNEKEKLLKINISPPFWETIEFKLLAVLLISVIIYLAYKLKMQSVKEQKEKLEKIVEERTKELVQINNTKDKFFSIIAHDLKNPFVSLLGFTEILHEESDDLTNEETKEITSNLRKSVRNLYGLLNNLLNWSTLQTGQMHIKETKITINELINHNIDLYKVVAERKKIVINKNLDNELLAFSDENMVNTILRNLISNAIKFTPEEGHITVNANKVDEKIEISVEDDGIGLTDVEIENILNPKVYLSMPGTNNEKGTGIGLALCREMLEKNGGKLLVSSNKGRGSIFKFHIKSYSDQT